MNLQYFYHSTSLLNLENILQSKLLMPKVGHSIGGNNEDFISVSDYLNDYLFIVFGNVIIEFYAKNIIQNNNVKPTIYDEKLSDFEDMPFEECEWKSKKIRFDLQDIKKIIFVEGEYSLESFIVLNLCEDLGLAFQKINKNQLIVNKLDFYKKRYTKRINIYGNNGVRSV